VASLAPPPAGPTPATAPVVQRLGRKTQAPAKPPAKSVTGALAASAAAVVAATAPSPAHRSASHHAGPPPAYTASAAAPPPYEPPPPYTSGATSPPAYTQTPAGAFDPRELTDFQLDELVHRIIGRITRLIRTELRLDRERIGKLRDPRH
jgi:hypothetical protein